ncbi:hypothetical protein HELRODRAFT_175072 [Helobdella robusta]|uniref:RING-type domain-containing protein n=1 Tax=Helobdella robusta TaxID=6412 RepID=T1F8T4_HELRO|nr:hypothetical protein HELRODRAFT_175072 [Helobdella robusta]ESO01045.1 hypothetical protein HELRODRAFT_175072 [Helobdella robusta]
MTKNLPKYYEETLVGSTDEGVVVNTVVKHTDNYPSLFFWERNYHVLYISGKFTAEECPICLVTFNEGDKLVQMQCSHIFHEPCFRTWFKRSKTCPYCRLNIWGLAVFSHETDYEVGRNGFVTATIKTKSDHT